MTEPKPKLYEPVEINGKVFFDLKPHRAQLEALDAKERFILLLAGKQSGKTEIAVQWLLREIDKTYNPDDKFNDYLVITSTFPLLDKKLQQEFLNVFRDIGDFGVFLEGKRLFKYHDKNIRIFLCSGENPESLEAATAKAALLDEAGQDSFKRQVWDAIQGRLSIYEGRALFTTTIYNFGWLKTELYDRAMSGDKSIKVIHADSIMNPAFPQKEWDRLKATLPTWQFDMFYRGRYTRPAGMIYDAFDSVNHVKPRFPIPKEWNCYVGMDFGTEHTAAMFYALEPTTGIMWAYQEYVGGKKSVQEHVENLKILKGDTNVVRISGGIRSEEGWRNDFGHYGWHVQESPVRDVEQGILKVYAFHKAGKLMVFSDLHNYIDQKQKYSRILDENNNYQPTDRIKDKEWAHLCDAERGVLGGFDAISPVGSGKILVRSYV
uniref:Putative terminase n=1 Tax=viral metagenome TaxID=1070528 RepID=A0A6M3LKK4_9ZZZZ